MKENNTKTHKKLQKIFREVFDDDALVIVRETTAEDIEDWDSFAQISIVTGCEKVFNVHFEINEILVLKDVGDMMNLIERKLSA
jgi:acyl carrier protein